MTERDKINVIVANLSGMGKNQMGEELTKIYDNLIEEAAKYYQRLQNGRDYLMQVEPDEITVEDSLESFGFGRNGLG
jgi:hypothetical protein